MSSRLTASVACLVLLGLASLSCSPAPAPRNDSGNTATGKTDAPPQPNQSHTEFARLVDKWTSGKAQALPGHQPDHYYGDFDGDGNRDAAVPIQFGAKGASRELSNVRVLNPWLLSVEPTSKDVHETDSDRALLVVHGTTKEWNDSAPMSAFVLLDSVYDELRVINRGSKDGPRLPSTARGDCFLTGTEDAKGIIYWNGTTYLWEQRGD